MREVMGLPRSPQNYAVPPLKSAEPSIMVIRQTMSRKAVAVRQSILTAREIVLHVTFYVLAAQSA